MTLKVITSGTATAAVANNIEKLVSDRIASRIFSKDDTLWGKDAEAESAIRLGWTQSAEDSKKLVSTISEIRAQLVSHGVSRFVLCGMGGSSLAPEVITNTAGVLLTVLDSTNADQVSAAISSDLDKTAVIVSSKSGSTVETDSQKRIFEQAFTDAGIDKTERIIVVTDPGSPMEKAAIADGYQVINADPTVGGRYSALTAFGLVPSGLAGVDIEKLLSDAGSAANLLAQDSADNPGLILGAAMASTPGEMGNRDKLGIVSDGTNIAGFGDWVEQLVAESTGKIGKGVLPVVLTPTSSELHSGLADLLPIHIQENASPAGGDSVSVSGSIGEQFLLWEFATAVASMLLGVNPFDQPDVESAKIAARGMLEKQADIVSPDFEDEGISVNISGFDSKEQTLAAAFKALLTQIDSDEGYFSIHAYLDRNSAIKAPELRDLIANHSRRPVTFGWGPRFLHSTGQYHKGGPKQGVYLQLIAQAKDDIKVPGREFTLNQLISSQAAGDAKVLANLGRPVLTLRLSNVEADLERISKLLK